MGKRGESGENIEKHGKTGRIRAKHTKTRENRENQGNTWKNNPVFREYLRRKLVFSRKTGLRTEDNIRSLTAS